MDRMSEFMKETEDPAGYGLRESGSFTDNYDDRLMTEFFRKASGMHL